MFGWNKTLPKTSLADTACLNTFLYIQKREETLSYYISALFNVVCKDIIEHSTQSAVPEKTFNLADTNFCVRVTGLVSLTSRERDVVLSRLGQMLEVEKFTYTNDGTCLSVKWRSEPLPISPLISGQESK